MTLDYFEAQMGRLSGLRFPPVDLTTHWEALRDLPADVLSAAVGHAQRTRVEFPTPVELRRDADAVRPRHDGPGEDRYVELPAPVAFTVPTLADGTRIKPIVVDREWKFYCDDCHDSGRVSLWCGGRNRAPWMIERTCESRKCERIRTGHADYGHEWVTACMCVDSNPEIRRRKDRDAQYAAAHTGKDRR